MLITIEFSFVPDPEQLDVGWAAEAISGWGLRKIVVVVADVLVAFIADGPDVVLKVVPVLFRERIVAYWFLWVYEKRGEIDSFKGGAWIVDPTNDHEGFGDVDRTDETLAS